MYFKKSIAPLNMLPMKFALQTSPILLLSIATVMYYSQLTYSIIFPILKAAYILLLKPILFQCIFDLTQLFHADKSSQCKREVRHALYMHVYLNLSPSCCKNSS